MHLSSNFGHNRKRKSWIQKLIWHLAILSLDFSSSELTLVSRLHRVMSDRFPVQIPFGLNKFCRASFCPWKNMMLIAELLIYLCVTDREYLKAGFLVYMFLSCWPLNVYFSFYVTMDWYIHSMPLTMYSSSSSESGQNRF